MTLVQFLGALALLAGVLVNVYALTDALRDLQVVRGLGVDNAPAHLVVWGCIRTAVVHLAFTGVFLVAVLLAVIWDFHTAIFGFAIVALIGGVALSDLLRVRDRIRLRRML